MKARRGPRRPPRPIAGIDLEAAIGLVGAEYENFMASPGQPAEATDAKAFVARHAAARAALAHVEHLHRLAQQVSEGISVKKATAPLIAMARQAIAQAAEPEEEPEADDLSGDK